MTKKKKEKKISICRNCLHEIESYKTQRFCSSDCRNKFRTKTFNELYKKQYKSTNTIELEYKISMIKHKIKTAKKDKTIENNKILLQELEEAYKNVKNKYKDVEPETILQQMGYYANE